MIKPNSSQILVNKSDELLLNCNFIGGNPRPIINWLYNGSLILPLADNKFRQEENSLTIKDFERKDKMSKRKR